MVNVKEKVIKKKATIQSTFEEIMVNVDFCSVVDIDNEIANRLGISVNSVRGTTFGTSDKFTSQPWFTKKYKKVMIHTINGKQSCIINKELFAIKLTEDSGNKLGASYDSEEKKKARVHIYKETLSKKSPYILTMGGEKGLDIKYALEKNDNCDIINIEKKKPVFELYKELGYNTTDFNTDMLNFLSSIINSNKFDLINYDSFGYISKNMNDTLVLINEHKRTKYLALTVQHMKKGFRNTGEFAKFIRMKYKDSDNSQFECIMDIMTNYVLVSEYHYKQSKTSKPMVVYKFKLKK